MRSSNGGWWLSSSGTTQRDHEPTGAPREQDGDPPEQRGERLAAARSHDSVWNAAQRELLTTGRMHNYLRMLWGKKILEWMRAPQEAAAFMIELNNRYAVDGRDPNSYSGIYWVLGRYDHPWAPRRPSSGRSGT